MKLFFSKPAFAVLAVAVLAGCQTSRPSNQMGMVTNPATGIQYGSMIQRSINIDADQFENNKIKVTARNTSGDVAFDIRRFRGELEQSYEDKGFEPVRTGQGIKLDINVVYSGHIQRDMSTKYGFLGAAAGGIAGSAATGTNTGIAAGALAGATLGAIIGSTQTIDTYIVITQVSIGISEPEAGVAKKTVVFGSSEKLQKTRKTGIKPYRSLLKTKIAVYGGGRNVAQNQVIGEVKRRLIRIVGDVI